MFEKNINVNDRTAMVDFLKNHFRYNTMNSWNNSTSYANNVKVYNLGLTAEQLDKAYEIVGKRYYELDEVIRDTIFDFREETGYDVGFNGRCSGYIVLYQCERDNNGTLHTYPGRSIDMGEDFEDWTEEDLRDRVELVRKFDHLCDEIRDMFIYYVEHSVIRTIPVTYEKTIVSFTKE